LSLHVIPADQHGNIRYEISNFLLPSHINCYRIDP
jgi:hypothetical protein